MRQLYQRLTQVAATEAPVLVSGESGTGKELVARTLHDLSPRREGEFLPLNCSAISPTLIESELFGHEKGAFTNAIERHLGCFEQADGGTLFLDEITEMAPEVQPKLLRVLEENRGRRIGGNVNIPVSVRVVAALNRIPFFAQAPLVCTVVSQFFSLRVHTKISTPAAFLGGRFRERFKIPFLAGQRA